MDEQLKLRLEEGKRVQFTYHERVRQGTIKVVLPFGFVLELDIIEDDTKYKRFAFGKIVNLEIIH